LSKLTKKVERKQAERIQRLRGSDDEGDIIAIGQVYYSPLGDALLYYLSFRFLMIVMKSLFLRIGRK